MMTSEVETFISDSGYTRYHITAPVWKMFEEARDPHWKFPEGLDLEQYDIQMRPTSSMRCDSATYFSQKRLWRLDGNVVMVNTLRDSFLTQQVFWDQSRREVYSDSFIHIVRSNRIIEGYGFTSNERMTAFSVNRTTGIIPINRSERTDSSGERGDSVRQDRSQTASRRDAPVRASQRPDTSRPLMMSPYTHGNNPNK